MSSPWKVPFVHNHNLLTCSGFEQKFQFLMSFLYFSVSKIYSVQSGNNMSSFSE